MMSLWNHYSNYTESLYAELNNAPDRVGPPLPRCPDDIHVFSTNWITRGWFDWENEGYPFWGNLHHTRTWWEYRHLDNILFVNFADLLRNLQGEIRRIADYLDIRLDAAAVARIAERVSLEAMREEAVQQDPGMMESFREGARTFYFKGVNGRWKDVLSPDELALYDAAMARNLSDEAAAWLLEGRGAMG
jgi:aryl sulfotransferase